MPKKKSAPPIPPLSLDALKAVEKMEDYARNALRQCDSTWNFNREKAIRILRTCVVEVLDRQLDYYITTPLYDPAWVSEIANKTVDSALSLNTSTRLRYEEARTELLHTLVAHLSQREESGTVQKVAAHPPMESESIGKQIKSLLDICRLTVEELAESVGVAPRSIYRHLSSESLPRMKQIARYEKVFSDRLGKQVWIETSPKRQANVTRQPNVSKTSGKRHQ